MNLVYLAPVPWASFAQRSHKFVDWFQAQPGSGKVLWIEPYPTRLPRWHDLRRPSDIPIQTSVKEPRNLTVLKPRALPIEPLPASGTLHHLLWNGIFRQLKSLTNSGPTLLGVGKPSELAVQLLEQGHFAGSFYDAMDDFPAFYDGFSRGSMNRRESAVAGKVSCVFASSSELLSKWQSLGAKLVLNACDTALLPAVELRKPRPKVLGYLGTVGEWFDWDLVFDLARARPECRISLVGPVFTAPPSPVPENIEMLPPCSHGEAMARLANFGVGLIPFKRNRLTQSVDPIKYYEYRAMGLPVISSSFGEMRYREKESGVFLLDPGADFDKAGAVIDAALEYSPTATAIEDFRTRNSWEERFGATDLV